MILFILDLIGSYQGIWNLKYTRKRNFEWLHFLWQVVQNYKFAKSQEKPHKMLILNREVRPPTLNFWYFFWFRMVPYGPNINVPGFPKFFSWKVAFLQHSNVYTQAAFMKFIQLSRSVRSIPFIEESVAPPNGMVSFIGLKHPMPIVEDQ